MNVCNSLLSTIKFNKNITPPIVFLNFNGNLSNSGSNRNIVISSNSTISYGLSNTAASFNNTSNVTTDATNKYVYFKTPVLIPVFSVCVLINVSSIQGNSSFLSMNFINGNRSFILYNSSSFKFMNATNIIDFTSSSTIPTNSNTHIAIVFTANNQCTTYYNGAICTPSNQSWSGNPLPNIDSSFNTFIGVSRQGMGGISNDNNYGLQGYILKFQFYDYNLNSNQVKYLYDNRNENTI
jgi:hypothetical protein